MIDKDEILKNIELTGDSSATERTVIIAGSKQVNQIASVAGGSLRVTKSFQLILSKPQGLEALSQFDIRCVLCRKVIGYPCWYRVDKYAINHFHFFICFDSRSPKRPTCKCIPGGIK